MTALHEAYYAAVKADDAYSAELQRVYGSKAGDARYNPKLNKATPELRSLANTFQQANDYRHRLAMEANTLIPSAAELRVMATALDQTL